MPTADWREEKSELVVQAICRVLSAESTPQTVRDELSGEALWNALKLFADALQERLGTNEARWSPGLVDLFRDKPAQCDEWLALMAEPDFSAAAYWKNGD